MNKDSQFSFIKNHYLNEIIWFIKHNIYTLKENFEIFNKAFDFKTTIHQIKELKEYSSLSNEEKILFDKVINS
jgi:predicted Zn-dependent protease